jgi:hypothetical protein
MCCRSGPNFVCVCVCSPCCPFGHRPLTRPRVPSRPSRHRVLPSAPSAPRPLRSFLLTTALTGHCVASALQDARAVQGTARVGPGVADAAAVGHRLRADPLQRGILPRRGFAPCTVFETALPVSHLAWHWQGFDGADRARGTTRGTSARARARMRTHMQTHMHMHMHTHTHTRTHARTHAHTHTHTPWKHGQAHARTQAEGIELKSTLAHLLGRFDAALEADADAAPAPRKVPNPNPTYI